MIAAVELLELEELEPVEDPGSAFSWLDTIGSMLETPRTCEPVEATMVRIEPFIAVPIVAFTPPPVHVAIAEEAMFGICGVDAGVVFVAPLQKLEAMLEAELLTLPVVACTRKMTSSPTLPPLGDCHPSTAVEKLWPAEALDWSSVWMLLARLLVSVDDKLLQPDSGSAMINLSSDAFPAAIAVAVLNTRPAEVPRSATVAPAAATKHLERRVVVPT